MNTSIDRLFLVGNGWGFECANKGLLPVCNQIIRLTDDSIMDNSGRDCTIKQYLTKLNHEVIIFAGYKPIVLHDVIVKNRCINIHYSLLPKYRGFHSTVWAILNNEDYLGLTVHIMNDYIDDGPIIYQYKVLNDGIRTSTSYMNEFNDHIASNLGRIISDYVSGKTEVVLNDRNQASWVGKRDLLDCKVDFTRSVDYQRRFFRCLVPPYPEPWVDYKGKKLNVKCIKFIESDTQTHVGRILSIDDEGMWVKCRGGYLCISELKDADSDTMVPFSDFKIGMYLDDKLKASRIIM